MSNVTLAIIFNHKYNKNIPLLNNLYAAKFSNIVYIVPFYKKGELDNKKYKIISVYETSYSFQGYIAQAYENLQQYHSDHYLFIGDDVILHPHINESNFKLFFNLENDESYNTEICKINEPFEKYRWTYSRVYHNLMCLSNNRFTNFKNEIPTKEEAFKISSGKGFFDFTIKKSLYLRAKGIRGRVIDFYLRLKPLPKDTAYPLFGGYSDIFVISGKDFSDFAHLAGVFASMGMFAEIAIPTSMILTCKKIKQQADTNYKRGDIWGMENKKAFGDKHDFSLQHLFSSWPEDTLFIHPVKLSQWNI